MSLFRPWKCSPLVAVLFEHRSVDGVSCKFSKKVSLGYGTWVFEELPSNVSSNVNVWVSVYRVRSIRVLENIVEHQDFWSTAAYNTYFGAFSSMVRLPLRGAISTSWLLVSFLFNGLFLTQTRIRWFRSFDVLNDIAAEAFAVLWFVGLVAFDCKNASREPCWCVGLSDVGAGLARWFIGIP